MKKLTRYFYLCLALIVMSWTAQLLLVGCGTTGITTTTTEATAATSSIETTITNALPYIKMGAATAATVAINYAVSDSDKEVKCKCIYGLAHALYTMTGGSLPTVDSLKSTLESFAVSDGTVYANLIASVSDLYATYYPKLQNSNEGLKLGLAVINALAGGLEQAATAFYKAS